MKRERGKAVTLTEETISRGTKYNSMYEPNSVRGSATKADMMEYYKKESGSIRPKSMSKPNAMKVCKFKPIDLLSLSPVSVE